MLVEVSSLPSTPNFLVAFLHFSNSSNVVADGMRLEVMWSPMMLTPTAEDYNLTFIPVLPFSGLLDK